LNKRVFITGIGMVNPLGNSCGEALSGVCCGRPGLQATPEDLREDVLSPVCGRVDNLNPAEILRNRKSAKLMGRDSLMGIRAAREALTDAGVDTVPDCFCRGQDKSLT